jgi:hypothetical protein
MLERGNQEEYKPRIVMHSDENTPQFSDELELNLDFLSQFRALPPATLAEELKKKLEATERNLWDLETAAFALQDGPPGLHAHIQAGDSEGDNYEYNATCPCTRCEYNRTLRQRDLHRYALTRLRALYTKLMG